MGTAEAGTRANSGPVASWYVAGILRGVAPPLNAPYGRIAFKTGTSYGYRDAFAIGFDKAHTIAVWLGRPDNGAVFGLAGRQAAAPVLFDAFTRLGTGHEFLARPPVFSPAGPPRFPRPCGICARTRPRLSLRRR